MVTNDGIFRIKYGKNIVAEIPVKSISDSAPVYERPIARPAIQDDINYLDINEIPVNNDFNTILLKLLSIATMAQ